MSRRYIIILIVIVMIFPFPTTIVPAWKLKVVDGRENICPNKEVTQTWAHYSIYIGSGNFQSEDRLTNEEGYVEFPERTVWACQAPKP